MFLVSFPFCRVRGTTANRRQTRPDPAFGTFFQSDIRLPNVVFVARYC
jgi:hypothetical protein